MWRTVAARFGWSNCEHSGERRADRPTPRRLDGWQLAYLDQIEGVVAFGDTKAGLLLTADSILLAGLGVSIESVELEPLSVVVASVATGLLVAGLLAVLIAICPNARHFTRRTPEGNHFQFSTVTKAFATPADFVTSIRECSIDDLESEILAAIYGKSRWVYWKFRWLFVAVVCTFVAVVLASAAAVAEVVMS